MVTVNISLQFVGKEFYPRETGDGWYIVEREPEMKCGNITHTNTHTHTELHSFNINTGKFKEVGISAQANNCTWIQQAGDQQKEHKYIFMTGN